MALVIKHALPLDNNLISYLTAMTSSWSRKKLPIHKSHNGLAFWNGFFISIPDFRYSNYQFVVEYPLENQFSFYTAIAFHETMHAKFGSHRADKRLLINHSSIPQNFKNFSLFINNLFEDGRVERLGLLKREGSVIHHQLYRFNILISESNWKEFLLKTFPNEFDRFLNHLVNQLFDLVLLGRDFVIDYFSLEEEQIINTMNILLLNVFSSIDPNSSIHATIKFFELLQKFFVKKDISNQTIQLPGFPNHCHIENNQQIGNKEKDIKFDYPELDLDKLKEFFNNPFSDLLPDTPVDKEKQSDQLSNELDQPESIGDNEESKELEHSLINTKSEKNEGKPKVKNNSSTKRTRQHRFIPKTSTSKEKLAYSKFVSQVSKPLSLSSIKDDNDVFIDSFGNDMVIEHNETQFKYSFNDIESCSKNFYSDADFDTTYENLNTIALKTANYFLQLAGINIKKKDGVGNQKIILTSQKDGKLQLSGNTLSQLLAGNRFIYNKEMPAKINISLDLIILVDLTGSMEFQVNCDGRNASRIDFVTEATVILANTMKILEENYNLTISYSLIGYSAPDGSTPTLEILKDFTTPNTGKLHAKAVMSWYPDGENCDARALYESVKFLENLHSTNNKVIFFLSDGGGEEKDYEVSQSIKQEFPNFQFMGPKDFTDVIRYANMKGIKTYVINLEQIQNSLTTYDILHAFKKYYGENISLVENLNDLVQIFTKCLLEIFKKR